MKVIMVEPLKPAYVAEIGTDLESMQKAVGGDIETGYPYTDPLVLVCDEEGKYDARACRFAGHSPLKDCDT